MNLKTDGDALEQMEADWVKNYLPEYEEVWKRYIGHNRKGKPLTMQGFNAEDENKRASFFQAHYTVLMDFVLLRDTLKAIDGANALIPDPRAYVRIQKELLAFLASVGRIRDMFERMDYSLGLGGSVSEKFQEFYQQRCNWLHSSLPAQRIADGILEMPEVAGIEKKKSAWNTESKWSDASQLHYDVAPAQLQAIYTELLGLSRSALSKFLDRIKEKLSAQHAMLEALPAIEAGTTASIALSGVHGYFFPQANTSSLD